MRPLALAVLLGLLLAAPAGAGSYTVPRDIGGAPAAQCAFLGTSAASTLCSTTDPLPVTPIGGSPAAPAPTTSTTDPNGWGQRWFTGTYAGDAGGIPIYAVFESDTLVRGFFWNGTGVTLQILVSTNKGQAWSLINTLTSPVSLTGITTVARLSNGDYLLGGQCPATVTPACTGLQRWSGGLVTQVALPGLPAGLTGGAVAILQTGTRVFVIWRRGADSTVRFCRSTDSGATFLCEAANYAIGASTNALATPAANIILRIGGANIERSIDNGGTFAVVFGGVGSGGSLSCLSSTVCVATDGLSTIARSTDAGATWTTVFTAPVAAAFGGFAAYGAGVVAVVPTVAGGQVWLSADFGQSWQSPFTFSASQQCPSGGCLVSVSSGSTVIPNGFGGTGKVVYSPALLPGETTIVGPSGIPLNIDANGNLTTTANQGAASSTTTGWYARQGSFGTLTNNAWVVAPVQALNLQNSVATSAVNAIVSTTIAAPAGQRAHLYSVSAYCSAGTSALAVLDGATNIFAMPAGGVGTTLFRLIWDPGLTGTTGATMTISLNACGAGNTGTLIVQGDYY